ncbi:DNA-binding response regulator [Neobacillus piezotolerans]|uniref:DNA-binding response regulator n=1 Tax=Neobacillus piezotolerans TaxID=2259171 RepID=A0A3D8GM59_9BACI|nr:response regulator transcription factor [Neobacillus piezotolerans]RDU35146.1 DNA-binding response regulator [Neobacillus piezotolerans]
MEKLKVLIVDVNYMFLKGLETILNEEPTLELVGEARTGCEALSMAVSLKPDVILMDVNMPSEDGIGIMKQLVADLPESNILVLSVDNNEEGMMEALRYGAKGYLLKSLLPNELLAFIHMASRGEYVISGPIAKEIISNITKFPNPLVSGNSVPKSNMLTRREKEILSEVIKGMTNRQIACTLFISENTVKNHIRNIMEKLHMNNRAQVAAFALQEGWLQKTV